jgi:putative flippase GtrA
MGPAVILQKLRFALVGGVCAVLHNAIVIGGDVVGVHYAVSGVASYAFVVVVGYALHTAFTFRKPPSLTGFLRYAAGMATNLPVYLALMFVQRELMGIPVPVATLVATALMVVWNYVVSRWAILRPAPQPS